MYLVILIININNELINIILELKVQISHIIIEIGNQSHVNKEIFY